MPEPVASPELAEVFPSSTAPLPLWEIVVASLASLLFIALKFFNRVPFEWPEIFAFVTGGICVWLTVRENIWNWPIGIGNSLFFAYVFWHSRLFADMGLQFVYVVLGFYGWYEWLFGGERRTQLKVQRASLRLLFVVIIGVIIGTIIMKWHLERVKDAAPFLDALTTSLSLAAQYLLTRKFWENWAFWILADLIYIPLYWSRGLLLTAALYVLFLALCFAGVRQWRRAMAVNI